MKKSTLLQLALLTLLVAAAAAKKDGEHGGGGDPASQDAAAVQSEIKLILNKYTTVVMGCAIGMSLPLTFCGYKIISVVMFLAGATFSGYGAYLFGDNLIPSDFSSKGGALIATSVCLGLVGGLLAWKLRKLGTFLAGAAGGVVGAFALNGAVLSHLPTLVTNVPQLYLYIACGVFGILGGVLAFKLEKTILTLATAAFGAAMFVFGTKFFLEKYVSTMPTTTWGDSLVWAYLGGWLALFLVGAIVQHSIVNKKKKTNGVETRRKSLLDYEVTPPAPLSGYETIVVGHSEHKANAGGPQSKGLVINVV